MHERDRPLVSLVATGHALVHTYELSFPILISAWIAEFGIGRATIGLVLTIGYGLFGLGALPAGILVDKLGAKRMIGWCLAGMAASYLLLGFTTGVITLSIALLLWGVSASVYHPSGLTLISTAATERGNVFAYHGMAGNFGIAAGPLLTALLLVVVDWRIAVGILSIPAIVGAVYAHTLSIRDDRQSTDAAGSTTNLRTVLTDSRVLFTGAFIGVFGIVILSGLYYRGILTFLPEILGEFEGFNPISFGTYELPPGEYFYVAILMIGMVGQYIGGQLSDRVRPERGLAGGFLVLAMLALLFVPVSDANLYVFLLVGLLVGVFLFMMQPLYQAAVADHSARDARGLSYGYTYFGVFGIGALGSTIAGFALSIADVGALFVILAAIAGIAAGVATIVVVRT